MISVKDRIKQLRKETNFKYSKNKKKKITEIKSSKKKAKKRDRKLLKKTYTKEFIDYLNTLNDDDLELELSALEFMMSIPTEEEIYHRVKRENKLLKKRDEEYSKYLKSKKIKSLSDLDKYSKKFFKKDKKRMKLLKKKGLNVYDYAFSTLKLDENKMIENIKRITKEHKQRTDQFLEYVDKLFNGHDVPEAIDGLMDKSKKIAKQSKKYIGSLERSSIIPGMNFG